MKRVKMSLPDYLRARANSADVECRTDDADAMRDAAEALELRADEIEKLTRIIHVDDERLRWDAWKGNDLVAMIRPKGEMFNVIIPGNKDQTFILLGHAVNYVRSNF